VPRVVLDLNVVVSGVIEPRGPSGRTLRALFAGRLIAVVCPRLLAEAVGVCTRPRHRSRFSLAEAEAVLDGLEARAEIAPDRALTDPLSADPDDDYLVVLARDGL
jgi:putative PIN family toxin of toxin-antitoxin system